MALPCQWLRRAAAMPGRVAVGGTPRAPGRRRLSVSVQASGEQLVLLQEPEKGIATLTLNSPGKLNALTEEMGEQFVDAVERVQGMAGTRAVVLTGAGSAFSAGGDMAFLHARTQSSAETNTAAMRRFYDLFLCIRTTPVPVIAAINGHAIGAGLCLAGACDIRIAAESAKLGYTFVGLGLHPGMAATHFTPQIVGPQLAARLLLTGETVSGTEAAEMGLVAEACPADEVVLRAMALATRIADQSSIAVQTCIRTLRKHQSRHLEEHLADEAAAQAVCYPSDEMREGLLAIKEKRRPKFRE